MKTNLVFGLVVHQCLQSLLNADATENNETSTNEMNEMVKFSIFPLDQMPIDKKNYNEASPREYLETVLNVTFLIINK